jgi:hypothetical protein
MSPLWESGAVSGAAVKTPRLGSAVAAMTAHKKRVFFMKTPFLKE